ncbi:MAG: hypothetical protein JO000_12035 [Alphaproteobacteria bacterium]|nr:hypothetical protein [Alphaproteobacteria bacterium]
MPTYLLAVRDFAMPAKEIDRVFAQIKAATPGLAVVKPEHAPEPPPVSRLIAENGAAVLNIPSEAVESVKRQLGDRFLLELNPPLRHA